MAQDKHQSPVNIRQRLIGAVVLIALAVIAIPLVLDLRKDYEHVIGSSNIPPKPDDFRVEVIHFDTNAEIKVPGRAVDRVVTGSDEATGKQPVKSTAAVAATTQQTHAVERVGELRSRINDSKDGSVAGAGQAAAEAWVVQLASLTRKQNALLLQERVRKKGLHAFVVSSQVDGNTMYRVLVGPELLRSNAEKQRQRLQQEIKLSGLVIKYRR